MNEPEIFRPRSVAEVDAMIARHPLALVISAGGGPLQASPLPLVLKRDANGDARFIGHFSRHNPQVEALRREPRALIAFTGVQGYVSSAWLRDRRNAPTWLYEAAHFDVEVEFDDTPEAALDALTALVGQMDAGEGTPWRLEETPRLEMLRRNVVPFEARVIGMQAQFKLGQGETPDVLEDSLIGLLRAGNPALARRVAQSNGLELPSTD